MGDASSQLSKETLIYAFCYELVLFLLQRFPWIHKRRFARMAMEYCKPYWVEWKTSLTIKQVDKQVEQLKVVGDPSIVAGGVWQALITTAAGLVIAIPTFAFYRYFIRNQSTRNLCKYF